MLELDINISGIQSFLKTDVFFTDMGDIKLLH